jgi:hypothetical protein
MQFTHFRWYKKLHAETYSGDETEVGQEEQGTLHYIALHCITLHYIALHCITLHYIALHCITLHYIALHCSSYCGRIKLK